ncbi:acyltransferase [Parafrigoribacterium mesophilum]|uniref:acyltransferase family protein n=1 Tax=Parafrigoribacterium mesophilum TaxID=433646 RepID=UPI0031FBCEDC
MDKLTEIARRNNNFDALRIAAAAAVILGHASELRGHADEMPVVFGIPITQLAVGTFFVISGYLISGSWDRRPRLSRYLTNRVLRIIPGLLLVVVVTAFVLGPLVSALDVDQYFASGGTYSYLSNAALIPNYALPGVFSGNPFPGAVNGSLWTLPAEFACYLVVPVIGLLPRRLRVPAWAAFALVCVVITLFIHFEFFGARVESAALMWVFFAGGALVRLGIVRRRLRADVAAVVAVAWLVIVSFRPQWGLYAAWVALPYCLLAFGVRSTPVLRHASRFGDLSYGLYVWAFPVQQSIVYFFGVLPWALDVAMVAVVSAALAYGSWHLVERPSMAFAQRLPWSRDAAPPSTARSDEPSSDAMIADEQPGDVA